MKGSPSAVTVLLPMSRMSSTSGNFGANGKPDGMCTVIPPVPALVRLMPQTLTVAPMTGIRSNGSKTTEMCSVGRGTGNGDAGTMYRWMSTPSCGSPCFDAGIMVCLALQSVVAYCTGTAMGT